MTKPAPNTDLVYMDALDLTPTPFEARIATQKAAKPAKGSKKKPSVEPPPAVQ